MKSLLKIPLVLLALSAPLNAGADFAKGFAAYRAGDYATAAQEFKKAAEQGNAKAQNNLGTMYDNGRGVIQDDKEAVKLYRLAAEQGIAYAQINLGLMYANGEGVLQDDKEAVKWYRLAAEQGNADGQFYLGVMYGLGKGVVQDNVYRYMWFNIAASEGNQIARAYKDIIAKEMTPSQIAEAQKLARECVAKDYKGC